MAIASGVSGSRRGRDDESSVADLQAKWKQQEDPPSLCEHPIQELARLARSDEGYLMGTYHCRECGEAIVYIDVSPPFSNTLEID